LRLTQTVGRFVAQGVKVSNDYEITKLEIAKLELKEGDILAVKITGSRPNMAELAHLQKILESVVPQGVKTLVLHNDVELQIVSAPNNACSG
jgi:fructose-1-phosphate kinase PfkB-like protein